MTHVTGVNPLPLKQRPSHNLCGIHVFARAWMIATEQDDNEYDFTHDVVNTIHEYVKVLLLSGDERLCYKVTDVEMSNNDFGCFTSTDKSS